MKKLLYVLTVLLVLGYIGYQVGSNLSQQIETIDALMMSVEDKVTADGIFVRSSQPVMGDSGKTYEFLIENGEKVSKGQVVAVCFDSAAEAESFRAGADLEKDILYAERALKSIMGEDGGVTLDASIFANMQTLSGKLARGMAWDVGSAYSDLTQSVIAREYPREDIADLEQSIASMKAQLATYKKGGGKQSYSLTAQTSGYFLKSGETAPTLCTQQDMAELTAADVRRLAATPDGQEDERTVGYIVDAFEWYFVCAMDSLQANELEQKSTAEVIFPYISSEKTVAKVAGVSYEGDEAVVTFSCGYMDKSLLGGVSETADIIKKTYTGIKIPKEALHMNDGVWGVYCLNGAVVDFKPVEWIYQGDDYYLATPAQSSKEGLCLYDKIITRGKNLEKNRVIK